MNDPRASVIERTKLRFGIIAAAFFDIVFIFFVFTVLIFFCSGTAAYDTQVWLTLWHLGHAVMIVLALFLLTIDQLFVPLVFALLALTLFVIDIIVLVWRISLLNSIGFGDLCAFILFFGDVMFLITSIIYIGSVISATTYTVPGLFGDEEPLVKKSTSTY